jgi:hypothetical protein
VTVFRKRKLKTTFGTKREKVAGGWRKLHNQKFHFILFAKYCLDDQIKNEVAQHVA